MVSVEEKWQRFNCGHATEWVYGRIKSLPSFTKQQINKIWMISDIQVETTNKNTRTHRGRIQLVTVTVHCKGFHITYSLPNTVITETWKRMGWGEEEGHSLVTAFSYHICWVKEKQKTAMFPLQFSGTIIGNLQNCVVSTLRWFLRIFLDFQCGEWPPPCHCWSAPR